MRSGHGRLPPLLSRPRWPAAPRGAPLLTCEHAWRAWHGGVEWLLLRQRGPRNCSNAAWRRRIDGHPRCTKAAGAAAGALTLAMRAWGAEEAGPPGSSTRCGRRGVRRVARREARGSAGGACTHAHPCSQDHAHVPASPGGCPRAALPPLHRQAAVPVWLQVRPTRSRAAPPAACNIGQRHPPPRCVRRGGRPGARGQVCRRLQAPRTRAAPGGRGWVGQGGQGGVGQGGRATAGRGVRSARGRCDCHTHHPASQWTNPAAGRQAGVKHAAMAGRGPPCRCAGSHRVRRRGSSAPRTPAWRRLWRRGTPSRCSPLPRSPRP